MPTLWGYYEGRSGDPLAFDVLETGTFQLNACLAVGVTAIPEPLPKRHQQVLNVAQPGPSGRCNVLDEQQLPPWF
jgi:hypothetical protein